MAQVELKNLSKKYGKVTAVQNMDLIIPHNQFLVLVGPSGCGKSTTLRMIAGLEEITGGEILINDEKVNDKDPKDRNVSSYFKIMLCIHICQWKKIWDLVLKLQK